ncbi:hypothetical protein [Burkholderia phage FLC9]|nr:hypothetical protein [Burkholderia phage FLC9]
MALNLNDLAYPFDPTGSLASNLITGEQQILTAVNWTDYQFIVPRWAPFFYDSLVVTFTDTQGNTRTLVEGEDYYACFEFISASRACAKPIWGGVQFINPLLSGVIKLQYQTLGGIWTLDTTTISALLADRLANPRITAWEQVVDQPVMFPVIDHEWDLVDLVGASDIVAALGGIEDMLRQTGSTGLAAHLADFTNPHRVTATQVGLGLVQNFGIAQSADLSSGTSNSVYMTPAGVTTMMNAGPTAAINAHAARTDNPHATTAHEVGTYTQAEIDQLLAGYTPSGGAAANALLFNGMDAPTYRDWALSTGVASNSLEFGGQTPAAFTASVLGGTAANANELGGRTYAQVISDALSGKAADTFEFNGMDAPTYAAWVLANGTASNTSKFNNMTPADFASWVLNNNGPAADSTLLDGYTLQQVIAQASSGAGTNFAPQLLVNPTSGETAGSTYWTEIGQIPLPSESDPELSQYNDTNWIVSGGDSNNQLTSGLYLMNVNVRGPSNAQVTLSITNYLVTDPGEQFGYTIENVTVNGTPVPTIRLWLKRGANLNALSITRLSQDSGKITGTASVAVAPTGIVYATTDRFALESEVTSAIQTLTTAFNALATQISSS